MLEQRLAGLGEIGEILRSMKNLAFMETRKLGRLIANQREVVRRIDAIAADFLAFHQEVLPGGEAGHRVYLVVGSRRGFCGDFNERLEASLKGELTGTAGAEPAVIAVGHKLCRRLEKGGFVAGLDGADVVEELPTVLSAIVSELDAQRTRHGALELTVIYHEEIAGEPRVEQLLPPFERHRGAPPQHPFPAILDLPPRDFLLGLGEQYLFAALHAVLYESLLAENERRLRHLDGAVRHLDERAREILRRVRSLRQEEIIEEIEVILLSAAPLDEPKSTPLAEGRP